MTDLQAQTIRQRAEVMSLHRLVWMRGFAIAGVAIVFCVGHDSLGIDLPIQPLASVSAVLLAVNLVAAGRLTRPVQAVVADLMIEAAVLTIVLYLAAGGTNLFSGLFPLQASVAAFLLPLVGAGVAFVAGPMWHLPQSLPLGVPMGSGTSAFGVDLPGLALGFFFVSPSAVLFILGIPIALRQRDARRKRLARQTEAEKDLPRLGLWAGTVDDLGTDLSSGGVVVADAVLTRGLANLQEAHKVGAGQVDLRVADGRPKPLSRGADAGRGPPLPILRDAGAERGPHRAGLVRLRFALRQTGGGAEAMLRPAWTVHG